MTAARIGPNAIIQMAEALAGAVGEDERRRLFAAAGLEHYLAALPEAMVDEGEVTRLHRVVREALGEVRARDASIEAGERTGDYILANRIPKPVQGVLKILPPALASRLLLRAIARHAWTFAGSGVFRAEAGHPVRVSITGCPICRGAHVESAACAYYAATFERLFQDLVSPRSRVQEIACEALGAPACSFEIRWRR